MADSELSTFSGKMNRLRIIGENGLMLLLGLAVVSVACGWSAGEWLAEALANRWQDLKDFWSWLNTEH